MVVMASFLGIQNYWHGYTTNQLVDMINLTFLSSNGNLIMKHYGITEILMKNQCLIKHQDIVHFQTDVLKVICHIFIVCGKE